jgi:hypothetical protein
MKKTFRGRLADGGQDTIKLSTNNGLTGYKIVKFQGLPGEPGNDNFESVMKIFTNEPDSVTNTMNFSNPTLLGVLFYTSYGVGGANTDVVVFDNAVFNQDIYITYKESSGGASGELFNYHIELEQVKLSKDEATVATLKDMRAGPDTNFGP